MPRKKPYKGYEFRNIPPGAIIPPEIIERFIDQLSKLPIFKKGLKDVYLHAPEYPQTVKLGKDLRQLLQPLSSLLAGFFQDHRIDAESFSETLTKMTSSLSNLSSCKKELVASGITDEKTFDKIFSRVVEWRKKYREQIDRPIRSARRTKLVKDMSVCFRQFAPKIKGNSVFYCIAHIIKSFEIEEGNFKQIFGRIKTDFYRKR